MSLKLILDAAFLFCFLCKLPKVLHPKISRRLRTYLDFPFPGAAHSPLPSGPGTCPSQPPTRGACLSGAQCLPLRAGFALLRHLLEPAPNAAAFPVWPWIPSGSQSQNLRQSRQCLGCQVSVLCLSLPPPLARQIRIPMSPNDSPQVMQTQSSLAGKREFASSEAVAHSPASFPNAWFLEAALPTENASGFLCSKVNMHKALTLPGPPHSVPPGTSPLPSKWLRNWKMFFVCSFACFLAKFSPNLVILRERRQRKWSAALY